MLAHFHKRHLLLELLTFVALLSFILFFALQWQTISEPLPSHFGFSGQPNSWGDKSSLLVSLIIGMAIYIMISVIELFPRIWNFPVQLTEQNREKLITIALDSFILLKLVIVLAFGMINYWTITAHALPVWFLPLFLVILFGGVAFFIWKMVRYNSRLAKNKPDDIK